MLNSNNQLTKLSLPKSVSASFTTCYFVHCSVQYFFLEDVFITHEDIQNNPNILHDFMDDFESVDFTASLFDGYDFSDKIPIE